MAEIKITWAKCFFLEHIDILWPIFSAWFQIWAGVQCVCYVRGNPPGNVWAGGNDSDLGLF